MKADYKKNRVGGRKNLTKNKIQETKRYITPVIFEEFIFETIALGCTFASGQMPPCTVAMNTP